MPNRAHVALLFSTFAVAVCGLVYELLAGTVSSYLLGDSVYQFSIVIGLFMAAMGLGSYLTRYITERLTEAFIGAQLIVGLVGGLTALVLFYAFAYIDAYTPVLIGLSVVIGALIGVEIPLVIRILRDYQVLKLNVSNVFTVDYLGALLASLLFPIILVPHLGLVRTGIFFGMLNVLVAGIAIYTFRDRLQALKPTIALTCGIGLFLLLLFTYSHRLTGIIENRLYSGEIIYSAQTPFQKIVLTRQRGSVSLFLNGALQFNSLDEYRYHESLVHPALSLAPSRETILVLGGGDGLAVREILKHSDVKKITLVDIDPAITELFSTRPGLMALSEDSLNDPRVKVVNADASKFLETTHEVYDVVLIDLPDPHDIAISRLYTRWFYLHVRTRLAAGGIMVTQATSPYYAREAYWSIVSTIETAHSSDDPRPPMHVIPYHTYVPTFGDWGFVMASPRRIDPARLRLDVPLRYLNQESFVSMQTFPPDQSRLEVEANTIQTHELVRYYEKGWEQWYR